MRKTNWMLSLAALSLAAAMLAGCGAETKASKQEVDNWKNPSMTPPPGATPGGGKPNPASSTNMEQEPPTKK